MGELAAVAPIVDLDVREEQTIAILTVEVPDIIDGRDEVAIRDIASNGGAMYPGHVAALAAIAASPLGCVWAIATRSRRRSTTFSDASNRSSLRTSPAHRGPGTPAEMIVGG